MTTITISRETFDAMRNALEHIQRCIGFDKATIHHGSATWCEIEDALSAAKAVQPQACDMGAMCLDCQPRGKHGECPDQQPQAQGNEGVIEERMALADLCDAMGSPNIAEYLRAQAEISRNRASPWKRGTTVNLQRVSNTRSDRATHLRCIQCERFKPDYAMFADLDGEPFKAYYCDTCAQQLDGGKPCLST